MEFFDVSINRFSSSSTKKEKLFYIQIKKNKKKNKINKIK